MFPTLLRPLVKPAAFLISAVLLAFPLPAQGQVSGPFTISGVVTDAEDGTPLQYAVLGIPELGSWALSEADGSYYLEVPEPGIFSFMVVKRGWYLVNQAMTFGGPGDIDVTLYAERDENPVGSGRLVGRVLEKGSDNPVRGATVRITPPGQETRTDPRGRFLISDISAGAILVEVEREGYSTLTDTLATLPGVTLAVDIGLSETPSDPPEVSRQIWPRYLESVGFYRRAESRRGHRFGRLFIQAHTIRRFSANKSPVLRKPCAVRSS